MSSGGGDSPVEMFWERYRRLVLRAGVEKGVAVWYRRHVEGFIRFIKPRRLRQANVVDVSQYLLKLDRREDTEAWQVRQADKALRLMYQELLNEKWAEEWAVPLPMPMEEVAEVKGFLEELAVGGKVSASTQNQALNALVFYSLAIRVVLAGHFSPQRFAYKTSASGNTMPPRQGPIGIFFRVIPATSPIAVCRSTSSVLIATRCKIWLRQRIRQILEETPPPTTTEVVPVRGIEPQRVVAGWPADTRRGAVLSSFP